MTPVEVLEKCLEDATRDFRRGSREDMLLHSLFLRFRNAWTHEGRRAQQGEGEARCTSCDGTGDMHRPDGEWLGECPCGAAVAARQGEPVKRPTEAQVKEIAGKHASMKSAGHWYQFSAADLDAFAIDLMDNCRAAIEATSPEQKPLPTPKVGDEWQSETMVPINVVWSAITELPDRFGDDNPYPLSVIPDLLVDSFSSIDAHYRALAAKAAPAGEVARDAERMNFLEECVMQHGCISARRERDPNLNSPTFGDLPTVSMFTVPSQHVRGIGFRGAVDEAMEKAIERSKKT